MRGLSRGGVTPLPPWRRAGTPGGSRQDACATGRCDALEDQALKRGSADPRVAWSRPSTRAAGRGRPAVAGKMPALRGEGFLLLLRAEDCVFGSLGETELEHALRRDLDDRAGGRVAAFASLAVRQHELSEAWQGEPVLRLAVCGGGESIEELGDLLLR